MQAKVNGTSARFVIVMLAVVPVITGIVFACAAYVEGQFVRHSATPHPVSLSRTEFVREINHVHKTVDEIKADTRRIMDKLDRIHALVRKM